jgi:very-short-patch-repair endonuclease
MYKSVDSEAINEKRNCVRYRDGLLIMSRRNRKKPTQSEKIIWKEVLSKDKTGYRFLRQKPIDRFIVDFYCSELSLAIEIDGESHIKKKERDEHRDKFLSQIGITSIRFTNNEVINNIEIVKNKIIGLIPLLSKRGKSRHCGTRED